MQNINSSVECLDRNKNSQFALDNNLPAVTTDGNEWPAYDLQNGDDFEKQEAFNLLDMSTKCDCTYQNPTRAIRRNPDDKKGTAFIKISTESIGRILTTKCNSVGCDKKALFWIKSPKNDTKQKAYLFAQSAILSFLILPQIPGSILKEIGSILNLRGETVGAGFFGISFNLGGGIFNALGKIAQLGTPTVYKLQLLKFKRRYRPICCLNILRRVCSEEMISSCYTLAILGAAADLGVCFNQINSGPIPTEWLNRRTGTAAEGRFLINEGFLFRELVSYNLECRGRYCKTVDGVILRTFDKNRLKGSKTSERRTVLIFWPICLKSKSVAVVKPETQEKSNMIQINADQKFLEVKPYSFREKMG